MSKRTLFFALALTVVASPAGAGYKLMPNGREQGVGKAGLVVTPENDWNRLGTKIGRNAEIWTIDGLPLNDLSFYAGIENDKPLFREVDKRDRPLPRFSSRMLPTDIVGLFERSYRVAAGTSLFEVGRVEPVTFAGQPGVRFGYSFVQQDEEVHRQGEATGAIVNGRLYLISFEAPSIYYFERDVVHYRQLTTSARIR